MEPDLPPYLQVYTRMDRDQLFPLVNGQCLHGDKPPAETTNVLTGEYRQVRCHQAACCACHPLGADHGAPIGFKFPDLTLEFLWLPIVVERDHVRCGKLK